VGKQNEASINKNGILPSKAKGATNHVWLHTFSNRHWAILHTAKKHGVSVEDVIIFEVKVTRKNLTPHNLVISKKAKRGFWKCPNTINPSQFVSITDAETHYR